MFEGRAREAVAVLEGIRIALDAIWAQKLRSFLTLLCVVIAILSIIAVVSVLDGMDKYVREQVAKAGTNVFTLQRANELEIFTDFNAFLQSLKSPRIRLADAHALREEMGLASYVDPGYRIHSNVYAADRKVENVEIQGRSEEYPGVDDLDLHIGRHLTEADIQTNRAAVVLGSKVAEMLFPDVDPLGRKVHIGGRHYEVVGTFEERSNVLGNDRNSFAIIPISSLLQQFGARRSLRVYVKARDLDTFPRAVEEARTIMRIRRGLHPGDKDNFNISTAEQFVTFWEKLSKGIFLSLIGIVSITLVVGGIIIMNVMLVSVTERTREIGIRKALGAMRRAILFQFLVEAVTLTTVGGIIGIALGFFVAMLVGAFTPLPYAINPWSIVTALVIVFAVGIFFGLYPASRASRLDPVVALRHE
jgi:putative ABC transport system permease protein